MSVSLVVLIIAQDVSGPVASSFERATQSVLGSDAKLQMLSVEQDPPDEETVARDSSADGIVELTWSDGASLAKIHCYLAHEGRWVDREISFGASNASTEREAVERGRFLGFAVATMFSAEGASQVAAPPLAPPVAPTVRPAAPAASRDGGGRSLPPVVFKHQLEFAAIAGFGVQGTAAGLGASAGFRLALTGPLWARLFVAGRAGNIPEAQASTRSGHLGAGLAMAFLPSARRWDLGVRLDAFANYFEAAHLSEDDAVPDRQSRWLPAFDLLAEVGGRVTEQVGVFAAGGMEATLGHTEIYTHGARVAVVPPLRAVMELGFRTSF